jgi:hypothetical protein
LNTYSSSYVDLHRNFAANKVLNADNKYPTLLARNLQLPPSHQAASQMQPSNHQQNTGPTRRVMVLHASKDFIEFMRENFGHVAEQ